MQVLPHKLNHFRDSVLTAYKKSDHYLKLRKWKGKDRQKEMSIAVLRYILDHGIENVRRCELRRVFMAGGALHKRREMKDTLTDSELTRILKNLVRAGFVQKYEDCPPSFRTKDRQKKDIYYHTDFYQVDWLEDVCDGDMVKFNNIRNEELSWDYSDSYLTHPIRLVRDEIRAMDLKKTSDDALKAWIFYSAWALTSVEGEEKHLHDELDEYVNRKFTAGEYATIKYEQRQKAGRSIFIVNVPAGSR